MSDTTEQENTLAYVTRYVGSELYLCPNTGHWANWRDTDAIKHHGYAWPSGRLKSEHLQHAKSWDEVEGICRAISAIDWACELYDRKVEDKGYADPCPASDCRTQFLESLIANPNTQQVLDSVPLSKDNVLLVDEEY